MKDKKNILKNWTACALVLVTFVLPSFANEKADKQLESNILALLQQGKYAQIKTLLDQIPECPKEYNDDYDYVMPQLFQREISSRCTRVKFNPETLAYDDGKDVTIRIKNDKEPEYTKEGKITVVHPAKNLINAMNQHYQNLYGKEITTYNREHYLDFQKQFANSWLEDVSATVLAGAIWTPSKALVGDHATAQAFSIGKALYADADWHKAQGLTMAQTAQKKYPRHLVTPERNQRYTLDETREFSDVFNYDFGIWYNWRKGPNGKEENYATSRLYDGFWSEAVKHNNKALFHEYKRHIYYTLFATDKWEDMGYGKEAYEDKSSQTYAFYVTYAFGDSWQSPSSDEVWKVMAITMPQKQKLEMRANIKKHIVPFCENWNKIPDYYGVNSERIKEMCNNFQKYAKQYGIWPEDKATVQQVQRDVKTDIGKNFSKIF